jgi:hypothetical protein
MKERIAEIREQAQVVETSPWEERLRVLRSRLILSEDAMRTLDGAITALTGGKILARMVPPTLTRLEEAEKVIQNLADELEAEVEGRYRATKSHPAMASRYERDMETVRVARKWLEGEG